MPLAYALASAAVICALPAPVCAAALVRADRGHSAQARRALLALAVAVPLGALGPVVAAVDVLLTGDPLLFGNTIDTRRAGDPLTAAAASLSGADPSGAHIRLVAELGAGVVASMLLVVLGLLTLPAVATGVRARLRHVLDGVVIAASVFYIVWTLVIGPMHHRYVEGTTLPARIELHCAVVSGPTTVVLIALGVLVAISLKAPGTRRACAAAAVVGLGGAGLVVGAFYSWYPVLLPSALGYAVGVIGLAGSVRRIAAVSDPAVDRPGAGAGMSLALVALAAAACVTGLVVLRTPLDGIGAATAALIGGALAAQQALARAELRRAAERLARSEAHFRVMAHTDALTGLANRRQLLKTLSEEVPGGPPCVLLAIDLDGFKNINDIRGHDVGDAVLIEVARRLRANVRPGDLPVRLGGDEFAVLMWARPTEAGPAADRLLAVLGRPYELRNGTVFVSASIGLAGCATADDVPSLLRNADVALRYAKQQGKDRVEQYDVTYDQRLRRRTELEQELRGAVERDELMLMYQPIIRLADGRVAGVEALLRWRHPTLGQVAPDEFIPVAEDSGLIAGVGAYVLHAACHQLSRWHADGHDVYLAVNVSVRELHTPEYAAQVAELLRGHRIPAQRLVVEVTEHAVARDMEQVADRLAALRALGVRVALDDFGSGYSSLGQLRTLPVDILKIDRTLIEPRETAAPLADAVVRLGNRLGLDVVAEGISEPEQRRVLEEAGCQYAQGEMLGRPMPAERIEALFTSSDEAGTRPVQNVGSVDSGHEMRQS